MFEWVQKLLGSDLTNKALSEVTSKMMAYFLETPNSEMLVGQKNKEKEKLNSNDTKLGDKEEIARAKKCISEFKKLKG